MKTAILLSAYFEDMIRLSSSLKEYAASDAESSIITVSRFYFHRLSAYSELIEIKMFTDILREVWTCANACLCDI